MSGSLFEPVRILILTAHDDAPYVFALMRAGADGYVLKTTDPDDLVRSVKLIAAGCKVPAPDVAARVLAQVTSGKQTSAGDQVELLTEREMAVLRLTAHGWTNKAIAAELQISDRTVQGHLANIYSKLGVATRTEAVTKAFKLGWPVLDMHD
jgi:two-component system, NarL family, response regulator LiaR